MKNKIWYLIDVDESKKIYRIFGLRRASKIKNYYLAQRYKPKGGSIFYNSETKSIYYFVTARVRGKFFCGYLYEIGKASSLLDAKEFIRNSLI